MPSLWTSFFTGGTPEGRLLLQEKALSRSQELFDQADTSKDGKLQLGEVRDILRKSSEEYSHFAEHARFLDGYGPSPTWPLQCRWGTYTDILQDISAYQAAG